jgi:AsmA family protein
MKESPLNGTLTGRIEVGGSGNSIHQFAASANGGLGFVVPQGEINEAIAELTGINVTRALSLLLAKNEAKTAIRCSVIDFQGENGSFGSRTFFIDTTDVLIKGKGSVDFKNEALDLELAGDPKRVRFTRVRSPITLGGTLAHPGVGLDAKKLAAQGAAAAALGLLTPVAAVIAFVDPGLAKDKNCAEALSHASDHEGPTE